QLQVDIPKLACDLETREESSRSESCDLDIEELVKFDQYDDQVR
ncbi:3354_t:CDS:1, partial [Ambispora gerdemannii]